ncbi:MAG TPA: NosD domain-containing protein [Candidatus Acidoferrum sp.]|nr:NosD domain-containing protein [Candidatus Acidoferrum sp.]
MRLASVMILVIILGVLVSLILVFGQTAQIQFAQTKNSTIIVPDDFHTIQEAINNADSGDTVFVRAGIYEGNILVNKSISLVGESQETTIVNGNHQGSVITLSTDNVSVTGFMLEDSGPTWANSGVELNNVSNCSISSNVIVNDQFGVCAVSSTYNVITENNFSNNGYGIGLYTSSNGNSILENNVTESQHAGILLAACNETDISGNNLTSNEFSVELISSSNNTILGNNVSNSSHGVALYGSSNENEIAENNIEDNGWGLEIDTSANNTICHNNFIDNHPQVFFFEQTDSNIWDTGYPGGGNYWSDQNNTDFQSGTFQNETGSDGIADSPLTFNSCNEDHYPLMGEFTDFPVYLPYPTGTISHVDVISNFTVSNLEYLTWPNSSIQNIQHGQQLILLSITQSEEENQTSGFCLLIIPRTVLNTSGYHVLVDWNQVNAVQLKTTNDTTDYVYFTFNNSNHEIAVTIPEPAFTDTLALFTVTTLVLFIKIRADRRKRILA